MKREYVLVDLTHNAKHIKRMRICEVICKMLLYNKDEGGKTEIIKKNQKLFSELWTWDNYPPESSHFSEIISIGNIKWYVGEMMKFEHPEWTTDFLHGLLTCGTERIYARDMPAFTWHSPNFLIDVIRKSPFGGFVSKDLDLKGWKWTRATALYFKYSTNTPQYMAGVLASGSIVEMNRRKYAVYRKRQRKMFEDWGIPIEHYDTFTRSVYISPIWAALMTPYMPSEFHEKWLTIYRPFGTSVYCPILWYIYCDTTFPRGGIPYLKSRRCIFYEYECEEGALRKLEMLRLEKNLTQLDERIRQAVFLWKSKVVKKEKDDEQKL